MLTNGWYKWKDSRRGFAASSNYIQGVKLAENSSAFQRMDLVRGIRVQGGYVIYNYPPPVDPNFG